MMYKTGSVTVVVGSATVKGSTTVDFSANASAGDLFKIKSEAAFYDISAISTATSLSLSVAYANSNYATDTSLAGMSYQIVKDFTPNYDFPELSLNDSNFQQVYTKAMRLIDSALFEINASSVSASNDITVLATPSGFCLPDNSGANWRINVSNTGTLTTATY